MVHLSVVHLSVLTRVFLVSVSLVPDFCLCLWSLSCSGQFGGVWATGFTGPHHQHEWGRAWSLDLTQVLLSGLFP